MGDGDILDNIRYVDLIFCKKSMWYFNLNNQKAWRHSNQFYFILLVLQLMSEDISLNDFEKEMLEISMS